MKELQILSPDGKSRMIPLEGDRICLGRSTSVTLSYPNDSGLSRQHTLLEREGDTWIVSDLNSKNGTMLNGQPLTAKTDGTVRAVHCTQGQIVAGGALLVEIETLARA